MKQVMTRRAALRGGVAVITTAWVVPAIVALDASPASADTASGATVKGTKLSAGPSNQAVAGDRTLAFTGFDPKPVIVAGAGAVAVGAAAIGASRLMAPSSTPTPPPTHRV